MASIVALVAAGAVESTARADAPEATAQRHLDRGIEAFRSRDFTRARRELSAARDLVPHKPNPYRWLALTEIQLGDCARAIANIDAFIARVAADDDRLAELERLRQWCAQTGVLEVTTSPSPATLRIDGAIVGATPYRSLAMRAGRHDLVAEKRGFVIAQRSVVVPANNTLSVRLELQPRPPERPLVGRWWFWAATAGGLAIAGTVLFVVATDDPPGVLPPITCIPTGCTTGGT